MANGSGQYYTTKGQGSQEVYDAYYDEFGDSSVWQHVSVNTMGNIATTRQGGTRDFVTTHDSIEEITSRWKKDPPWLLIAGALLAYNFLL